MVHPAVERSGKHLFGEGGGQIALDLVDSKAFFTGVVCLTGRRKRKPRDERSSAREPERDKEAGPWLTNQ